MGCNCGGRAPALGTQARARMQEETALYCVQVGLSDDSEKLYERFYNHWEARQFARKLGYPPPVRCAS